jgi:hypothetical protein
METSDEFKLNEHNIGKALPGNRRTNIILMFYNSNFPILKHDWDHFISHWQTSHFMFALGKFTFFLMVPQGILKECLVHLYPEECDVGQNIYKTVCYLVAL